MNALFQLIAALPLSVVHALGGFLGRIVSALSPTYRRRLRANLAAAGYEDEAMARAASAEAGKQALETAWVWKRPPAQVVARTTVVDAKLIDQALADGRPVIFLQPHLGAFEVAPHVYSASRPEAKARPMTVLYRVPRKSILRPIVASGRTADGLRPAPADLRGVRMLMRAMKAREVVGIVPDQVPTRGDGVWAPFFGRWAYTMTLPARLARQFDAIVLLVWCERLAHGAGWRLHLRPLGEPLSGDPAHDAAVINRGFEALIRKCPTQYLWGYNRYKTPAGAEPAPATPATPGAEPPPAAPAA